MDGIIGFQWRLEVTRMVAKLYVILLCIWCHIVLPYYCIYGVLSYSYITLITAVPHYNTIQYWYSLFSPRLEVHGKIQVALWLSFRLKKWPDGMHKFTWKTMKINSMLSAGQRKSPYSIPFHIVPLRAMVLSVDPGPEKHASSRWVFVTVLLLIFQFYLLITSITRSDKRHANKNVKVIN